MKGRSPKLSGSLTTPRIWLKWAKAWTREVVAHPRSTSLVRCRGTVVEQSKLKPRQTPAGPTSVGMVLDTTNAARTSTNIINLGLSANGTTIDRLAALLRQNGVNAVWRQGYSIGDVAKATEGGKPLIAAVRVPGGGGHAIVVDGLTTRMGQSVVAIRDPSGGGQQYFELASEFAKRFTGHVVTLP